MSRRLSMLVVSVSLTSAAIQGCGGGGIDEGMPNNVDMSQDYTPKAEAGFFDARQMQKDAAKQAKGQ